MNNSREVNYNGTNTSHKWHWYYNRIILNCVCMAFTCFIFDLCLHTYRDGSNVFDMLWTLLDNASITIITACTIGILWEVSGKNDLIQEIQQHTDKSLRDAGLSNTLADQGILHTTMEFKDGIRWKKYIADADEIDVCWWAGSGWLLGNMPYISRAIEERGVHIRYVVADTNNADVLSTMAALSGVGYNELTSEHDKVSQELQKFGNSVSLHNVKHIPQYGMVRLGSRIVFFPYSHLKDRPQDRPTFVIDRNSELGERFMRDFEELLQAEGKHHSRKFGMNRTP